MKAKILALSDDKRNFVRAPPGGVAFEFDYASVSAVAMALLQEDPKLNKMRYFQSQELTLFALNDLLFSGMSLCPRRSRRTSSGGTTSIGSI